MKTVGSCYYVHKSNIGELLAKVRDENIRNYILTLANRHSFDIIKYNRKDNILSLIICYEFDEVNEPEIGDSIVFKLNEMDKRGHYVVARKNNPQIYHHKWMFVSDDYKGFDVSKNKKRSQMLKNIEDFNKKEVKSRIGNYNYWKKWCIEHGVEL